MAINGTLVETRESTENDVTENLQRAAGGETSDVVDPYLLQRGTLYRPEKRTFMPANVSEGYIVAMKEIVELCHRHSVSCVFVTQPYGYKKNITSEYMQSFWMTSPDRFKKATLTIESLIYVAALYNNFLIDFAADNDLPLCNLDVEIKPTFENFYDEMHFNEQGARNVAESLNTCISRIIGNGQNSA